MGCVQALPLHALCMVTQQHLTPGLVLATVHSLPDCHCGASTLMVTPLHKVPGREVALVLGGDVALVLWHVCNSVPQPCLASRGTTGSQAAP